MLLSISMLCCVETVYRLPDDSIVDRIDTIEALMTMKSFLCDPKNIAENENIDSSLYRNNNSVY